MEQVRGEDFVVTSRDGDVSSTIWAPNDENRAPVVLLGHGGRGQRRADRHQRFADVLNAAGIACLAIDGPFHGDRQVPGDDPWGYQRRVVAVGPAAVHERMRRDWLRALSAVVDDGRVDGDRVGFMGMSMGTRYGLLPCAALGARLRCAVLGKFGLHCSPVMTTQASNASIVAAARAITAPVLWHLQWDDETFPREGQLELFDLIASPEKQLRARAGGHSTTRPDDEDAWHAHLTRHLLGQ